MSPFHRLAAAGFAATAISYGPARIGFGLFVPESGAAFDLSKGAIGFIPSFGFLGFFISLLIAQTLLGRSGPAAPVLLGLATATAGLTTVAVAQGVGVLTIGVFLATSSAGFAWTPFNDAVHRKVGDKDRAAALSEISTGTAIGIVAAGLAALAKGLADLSWRVCWMAFALAGAVAFAINWSALPAMDRNRLESPRHA